MVTSIGQSVHEKVRHQSCQAAPLWGGAPGTQPGELQVVILLQEMLVADGDLNWSECA